MTGTDDDFQPLHVADPTAWLTRDEFAAAARFEPYQVDFVPANLERGYGYLYRASEVEWAKQRVANDGPLRSLLYANARSHERHRLVLLSGHPEDVFPLDEYGRPITYPTRAQLDALSRLPRDRRGRPIGRCRPDRGTKRRP